MDIKSIITALVVSGVAGGITAYAQVQVVSGQVEEIKEAKLPEKVAAITATVDAIEDKVDELSKRTDTKLEKIDDKLDRLIVRR